MYSLASGTIVSAGTSSPSEPGTQPVSSNISLAFSKRVLASLANALLMVRFSCVGSTALGFAEREVMEYQADSSGSLQFDPRKLDHLGPFLSIRGYEFSELVGRHRHQYHSHVCKPRLCLCISKHSIDLVVEFVDDLNRRVLWCTNAQPPGCLIARHKFVERRDSRHCLETPSRGDRKRAQLTRLDVASRRNHW